jgi:dihydropteroate synthase
LNNRIHLRPAGFVTGAEARAGVDLGWAGWLAGGPVAYTLAEILEGATGETGSRTISYRELADGAGERLDRLRALIEAPRGIDWAGEGGRAVRIMGIVNVTPDSFSDGGLHATAQAAITHGVALAEAGADIVDVGGESTRPGSDGISVEDELDRVLPVIESLAGRGIPVSIDTRKAAVMTAAVGAGATVINDITALTHDPAAVATAAGLGVPVVLMHAAGDPKTMQDNPRYDDVVLDVFDYLEARIAACEAAGISRDRLTADPGIGFGKTFDHNLQLISRTSLFHGLGVGLVVGASRKGFIGAISGERDARRRGPGSIAAALAAAAQGVQAVRVHDVAETAQALAVWEALAQGAMPA